MRHDGSRCLRRGRNASRPPSPAAATVFVNERVSYRTEDTQRVVSVHGVVFAHYNVSDRTAEAYARL